MASVVEFEADLPLVADILLGYGVGDVGRQLRIGRDEADRDDPRALDRVDVEPLQEGRKHHLLRRQTGRAVAETDPAEHAIDDRRFGLRRIKLSHMGQIELVDNGEYNVTGFDQLDLAGDSLRIEQRRGEGLILLAGEVGFTRVYEDRRLGTIFLIDEMKGGKNAAGDKNCEENQYRQSSSDRAKDGAKINLDILGRPELFAHLLISAGLTEYRSVVWTGLAHPPTA